MQASKITSYTVAAMQEEGEFFDISFFTPNEAVMFRNKLNETGGRSYRGVLSEKVYLARVKTLRPQRGQLNLETSLDYSNLLTCSTLHDTTCGKWRGPRI